MERKNNHNKVEKIHRIESSYIDRIMIGAIVTSIFVGIGINLLGVFITFIIKDEGNAVPDNFWRILWYIILGLVILILTINYVCAKIYYKNFSYDISEKFITIKYGILTRTKTTIPFSRVQNIAVYQNIRDRILHIYTVKIETAGSSAAVSSSQKGLVRAEGYIPAVKDPTELENMINRLIDQYTQQIPDRVKDKVFTDNNVAFDEFTAYFLSKLSEKKELETRIHEYREQSGLSQADLADKLKVSKDTISYLEAGKYVPSLTLALKIARFFDVSIDKIFELRKR